MNPQVCLLCKWREEAKNKIIKMEIFTALAANLEWFLDVAVYLHVVKNNQSPKAINSSFSEFYLSGKEDCHRQ